MSYVQHVTKNRYSPGSGTTNSPDWNFKTRKYIKNWNTQTSIFKVINCNFMNLFWYLWTHGISNIYGACAKRYVIFAAINIVVLKLDIKISFFIYNKDIFTKIQMLQITFIFIVTSLTASKTTEQVFVVRSNRFWHSRMTNCLRASKWRWADFPNNAILLCVSATSAILSTFSLSTLLFTSKHSWSKLSLSA